MHAEDAAIYCAMAEEQLGELRPVEEYLRHPALLPPNDTVRWFIINRIRMLITRNEFPQVSKDIVQRFLEGVPNEFRFALLVDLVDEWERLGATQAMFDALKEVTGL